MYNFTAQLVPFEIFEENILRITELCSFKIFAERLNSNWDSNTPFPVPPAYIPPEPILPPETDLNLNESSSELDQHAPEPEPVYSTSEEDSLSPELMRKICEAEEESLSFSPDSDHSGFSDPRFPEPEPSNLLGEAVPMKLDIIQVSEPIVKAEIEVTDTVTPQLPATDTVTPQLPAADTVTPELPASDTVKLDSPASDHSEIETKPKKEVFKSEEKMAKKLFTSTAAAEQSSRTSKIEKSSSFPILELFIFLLIFFTIVGALYLVWNNLHIFMPLFILAYAILKYWGKA